MNNWIWRYSIWIFLLGACRASENKGIPDAGQEIDVVLNPRTIEEIPLPEGFQRTNEPPGSFAHWLRQLPLRKEKTVYLYNGLTKPNQKAQYAVLDIPVRGNPLLQCADVIMKLRAEYLFAKGGGEPISFTDFAGREYRWKGGKDQHTFNRYMNQVYSWCGSASLEKQLKPVSRFDSIRIGDVLVQGGFPGHAVLVTDMATDTSGQKIFMLLQGYQPAQDIHILFNTAASAADPWYPIPGGHQLFTPEWTFAKAALKHW